MVWVVPVVVSEDKDLKLYTLFAPPALCAKSTESALRFCAEDPRKRADTRPRYEHAQKHANESGADIGSFPHVEPLLAQMKAFSEGIA